MRSRCRARKKIGRGKGITLLSCGVVGLVCICGWAVGSGYHPGFDEALEKASVVVEGTVVESWIPKPRGKSAKSIPGGISYSIETVSSGTRERVIWREEPEESRPPELRFGRVYRMRVDKVYKGATRPGEEVVMWDPMAGWMGDYAVDVSGWNFAFLVPPEFWGKFYRDDVDYGATTTLYALIENFSTTSGAIPRPENDAFLGARSEAPDLELRIHFLSSNGTPGTGQRVGVSSVRDVSFEVSLKNVSKRPIALDRRLIYGLRVRLMDRERNPLRAERTQCADGLRVNEKDWPSRFLPLQPGEVVSRVVRLGEPIRQVDVSLWEGEAPALGAMAEDLVFAEPPSDVNLFWVRADYELRKEDVEVLSSLLKRDLGAMHLYLGRVESNELKVERKAAAAAPAESSGPK